MWMNELTRGTHALVTREHRLHTLQLVRPPLLCNVTVTVLVRVPLCVLVLYCIHDTGTALLYPTNAAQGYQHEHTVQTRLAFPVATSE